MSFLKQFLIILCFISIHCQDESRDSDSLDDIVFKLADLTVTYQSDREKVTIEAFKSSLNDAIITSQDKNKYGKLTWLSIGNPRLVKAYKKETNSYELVKFNNEGFSIYVETLNDDHITLFQNLIKESNNIEVKKRQIVQLVPSKFECKLIFTTEKQKKTILKGEAFQLNISPLDVSFHVPIGSNERKAFEKRLELEGKNLDLQFQCEALRTKGKAYKTNILTISAERISQLGIIQEILALQMKLM